MRLWAIGQVLAVLAAACGAGSSTKAPKVLLMGADDNGRLDIVTTASADGGAAPAVFLSTGWSTASPGSSRHGAPATCSTGSTPQ